MHRERESCLTVWLILQANLAMSTANSKTLYDTLGINREATRDQIQSAYNSMVDKVCPLSLLLAAKAVACGEITCLRPLQ